MSSCTSGLWHSSLQIPLRLAHISLFAGTGHSRVSESRLKAAFLHATSVCRNNLLKSNRKPSQGSFASHYICLQEQVTQEYQKAISKKLSFTLHLFRGRPTSASTRRLVIAHFKAAATEHINSRTPLVGVPGSVAWKNGEAGHLYFVTVQRHQEPDVG